MEQRLKVGASRQSGVALMVTLILVALMALLAFAGSDTVRLQQRLASNDQASQIAFQGAEAALGEAFNVLHSATHRINFCDGVDGRYTIGNSKALNEDDIQDALENATVVDSFSDTQFGFTLTQKPRYALVCVDEGAIVGYTPPPGLVIGKAENSQKRYQFFRVYAQGFGPKGLISRVIEARYVFE
nr:PilX N-terminal domain-containing pilus assembly protein [uncultured Halomonas sp.]